MNWLVCRCAQEFVPFPTPSGKAMQTSVVCQQSGKACSCAEKGAGSWAVAVSLVALFYTPASLFSHSSTCAHFIPSFLATLHSFPLFHSNPVAVSAAAPLTYANYVMRCYVKRRGLMKILQAQQKITMPHKMLSAAPSCCRFNCQFFVAAVR